MRDKNDRPPAPANLDAGTAETCKPDECLRMVELFLEIPRRSDRLRAIRTMEELVAEVARKPS